MSRSAEETVELIAIGEHDGFAVQRAQSDSRQPRDEPFEVVVYCPECDEREFIGPAAIQDLSPLGR